MNRLGQRRTDDAAWYSGGIRFSHSSQWYHCSSEELSLIGPIGPALCAFPQQCVPRSHLRSSFAMFSIFSSQFPSATRRGVVSVSDMSSKNCDRMESIWDLGPMIWRIKTRRQPCQRRSRKGLLKSAPFALWASMSLVPSVCCPKTSFESSFWEPRTMMTYDDADGRCGHVEAEGTKSPSFFFAVQMISIDHRPLTLRSMALHQMRSTAFDAKPCADSKGQQLCGPSIRGYHDRLSRGKGFSTFQRPSTHHVSKFKRTLL